MLLEHRDLIAKALPGFYDDVAGLIMHKRDYLEPVSALEVKLAFLKMIECLPDSSRLCLFIDGIDEYQGDHTDIIELLKTIASPKVKMVLSSRPIRECVVAFENYPNLKLQDLTHEDIKAYAADHIVKYSDMPMYTSPAQRSEMNELVEELVTKSSGVFLWVTLVVKSLVKGLNNFDQIGELRERLNDYPTELDELYKHMMDRMDLFYRIQASKYLQIVLRSSEVQLEVPLCLLQMSFAEGKSFLLPPDMDMVKRCEVMEGRLTSRCCGLVETKNRKPGAIVNFLHKSVSDFLRQPEIWKYVTGLTDETEYSTDLYLARSVLWMYRKMSEIEVHDDVRIFYEHDHKDARYSGLKEKIPYTYLEYFRGMELTSHRVDAALLDDVVRQASQALPSIEPLQVDVRFGADAKVIAVCVHYGLRMHLLEKLKTCSPDYMHRIGPIVLNAAVSPMTLLLAYQFGYVRTVEAIVSDLLDHGADPNQPDIYRRNISCVYRTLETLERIWIDVMNQERGAADQPTIAASYLRILSILISHSAEVNARFDPFPLPDREVLLFPLPYRNELPFSSDQRSLLTVVEDVGGPTSPTGKRDDGSRLTPEVLALRQSVIQQLVAKGAKSWRASGSTTTIKSFAEHAKGANKGLRATWRKLRRGKSGLRENRAK